MLKNIKKLLIITIGAVLLILDSVEYYFIKCLIIIIGAVISLLDSVGQYFLKCLIIIIGAVISLLDSVINFFDRYFNKIDPLTDREILTIILVVVTWTLLIIVTHIGTFV